LGCALLPASCVLCGFPLPHLSSVPICALCWTEFPVHGDDLCVRCGDLLDAPMIAGPSSSGLCRACRMSPPAGAIVIGGKGPNTYQLDEMRDVAVVIDLGGATVLPVDPATGFLTTVYNGQTLAHSFIDSA